MCNLLLQEKLVALEKIAKNQEFLLQLVRLVSLATLFYKEVYSPNTTIIAVS